MRAYFRPVPKYPMALSEVFAFTPKEVKALASISPGFVKHMYGSLFILAPHRQSCFLIFGFIIQPLILKFLSMDALNASVINWRITRARPPLCEERSFVVCNYIEHAHAGFPVDSILEAIRNLSPTSSALSKIP